MAAVALACASAFLFGAMSVALRMALRRSGDAELGALVTVVVALVVALAAVGLEAPVRGLGLRGAWPFALAGIVAPGASQILFTLAIREAGASRTSVVVGAAPLVSVGIALTLLGESLHAALVAGALLVVGGGVELARERDRPAHFRVAGLGLALVATILFASRDNLIRYLSGTTAAPPAVAAAATLLVGSLVLGGLTLRGPRPARAARWRPFVPAGLLFGLSYVSLFEAYYRGRVSVVSPLVATESMWGVVLSALLLRQTELVGRRLLIGAGLIVAGGVLIGAFR